MDVIVDPVLPPKGDQQISGTNIEIKETQPEELSGEEVLEEGNVDEEMVGATRWQKAARKKQLEALNAAKGNGKQKPILDAESDLTAGSSVQMSANHKEEEKLSRAARRKKIKEQILADGEGESFKGYRRRMW